MKKRTPPPGGKEVVAGGYNFLNLRKGEAVEGLLMGTIEIKNQKGEPRKRHTILINKTLYVLPDHYDLAAKLDKVLNDTGTMARVWVEYVDKVKVKGVPNPMARYRVIDYGIQKPKA
jgi:hypothetical protein